MRFGKDNALLLLALLPLREETISDEGVVGKANEYSSPTVSESAKYRTDELEEIILRRYVKGLPSGCTELRSGISPLQCEQSLAPLRIAILTPEEQFRFFTSQLHCKFVFLNHYNGNPKILSKRIPK